MKTISQFGVVLTTALASCLFSFLTLNTKISSRHMGVGSCRELRLVWAGIRGPTKVSTVASYDLRNSFRSLICVVASALKEAAKTVVSMYSSRSLGYVAEVSCHWPTGMVWRQGCSCRSQEKISRSCFWRGFTTSRPA